MPEDIASKDDLDGLGRRVTDAEITQARQDERLISLEREAAEQKRDVWKAIGQIRDEGKELIVKVSFIMGGISFAGVILSVVVQIIFRASQ